MAAANRLFFLSTELEAEDLVEADVVPLSTFCEAVSHAERKRRDEIAVATNFIFHLIFL